MPLKQNYATGDPFGAADVNAIAAKANVVERAPFFARRDDAIPALFSYFGDKPITYSVAPPFDSGHVATSAGTAPSIVGGTLATLGSGVRASYYRTPNMGAPVTRAGARFRLLPGGGARTGGGTVCVAILNGLINPANITVDMAAHFFTTSTSWAFTVWKGGVGQTVLANGTYAAPLKTDYATEYEMQVWLNGTTAVFDLPDGTRRTVVDQRIADYAGAFAFFEGYLPNGDTDDIAAFTHVWADTGVVRIPARPLDRTAADALYLPRTSTAGVELVAARRTSQFTWNLDGQGSWTNIDGLALWLDTTALDGPVEITLALNLALANGSTDADVYYRILDFDAQVLVPGSFGYQRLIGTPAGTSGVLNALTGRVPVGRSMRRYVAQVQCTTGQSCYVAPDWLPGRGVELTAKGR